jgi:hypothetical protein
MVDVWLLCVAFWVRKFVCVFVCECVCVGGAVSQQSHKNTCESREFPSFFVSCFFGNIQ